MSDAPETTRTIEINGVKFEVDLRHAKRLDTFQIGSRVKVLKKTYGGYASYPGVVVGFDGFKELPTIIVAYVNVDYSGAGIVLEYINDNTKDVEICSDINDIPILIDKSDVITKMNREIAKKEAEIEDIKAKMEYFLTRFGQFFGENKKTE